MNPFVTLRNIVLWLATRALQVHDAVSSMPLLGNIFGTFFYNVSSWLFDIAFSLGDLASWYQRVTDRVAQAITSSDVIEIISGITARVNTLWAWFGNRAGELLSVINSWWEGTRSQVLAWVQEGKDYSAGLIVGVRQQLNGLSSSWESFRTSVLPSLATRQEAQELARAELSPHVSLLTTLGTFVGDIADFFGDPLGWLAGRLEEWFWGKEGE